jgi:NADPH:quinone reductase-like Zn-dependent oxidoreductase
MKAVRIHEYGEINVLRHEEVERPEPRSGEVLVRIHAAGVNPIDAVLRRVPMPITIAAAGLPYTLGWDIAGEVVALGEGVTQFHVGDAVYGMPCFPGEARGYGEYTAAPATDLALKPRRLSYQEAAAVPLVALTAWQALFDVAHLRRGQTVFISGGAGGVGHLAVQLAHWAGARGIATTSTRNVAFVRELGADSMLDYTRQEIGEAAREVDVVLDAIGGAVLEAAFALVKRGGAVVSLPGYTGVRAIGDLLAPRHGATFTVPMVHPSGEQLAELARLFDAGRLRVHLDGVFPLAEAARAHTLVEGGHVRGKLVLSVA